MGIAGRLKCVNDEAREGTSMRALHGDESIVEILECEVREESKVGRCDSVDIFGHDYCFI